MLDNCSSGLQCLLKHWIICRVLKEMVGTYPFRSMKEAFTWPWHSGGHVLLGLFVGWCCVVLSPRDYSDLKRLRCLLNVQSSKQQVVFFKEHVCVSKREILGFCTDPFNVFMNVKYQVSLFFHTSSLSPSEDSGLLYRDLAATTLFCSLGHAPVYPWLLPALPLLLYQGHEVCHTWYPTQKKAECWIVTIFL